MGITALLPTATTHLLGLKSTSKISRRFSLYEFCRCMQVLQRLHEIYSAVESAIFLLNATIQRADIRLLDEWTNGGSEVRVMDIKQLLEAGSQTAFASTLSIRQLRIPIRNTHDEAQRPNRLSQVNSLFIDNQCNLGTLKLFSHHEDEADTSEHDFATEDLEYVFNE
jgi:hypothetical protein